MDSLVLWMEVYICRYRQRWRLRDRDKTGGQASVWVSLGMEDLALLSWFVLRMIIFSIIMMVLHTDTVFHVSQVV